MADLSEPTSGGLSNDYEDIPAQSVNPESDRVLPRQTTSGVTRGIQQLGSDKVYSDGGNNQIIVEDTTTPRVLMGDQASFGEGFYVTKAGINVKTNTDASQFIFNSNQNVFKIVSTGTMTVTKGASATVGSFMVTHGLGYRPAVIAFSDYLGANALLPYSDYNQTTGALVFQVSVIVDTTTVTGTVLTPSSAGSLYTNAQTFIIRYYLLQETAT